MSTTNDGGPVFPQTIYQLEEGHWEGKYAIDKQVHGMSLRDYFAGQALAGVLACSEPLEPCNVCAALEYIEHLPELSYRYADAMLAARETK